MIILIRELSVGPQKGDSLLPRLDAEKIMRIEISSANSTAILERTGQSWKAASLHGYPAKNALVDGFIEKLKSPVIESTISDDTSIQYDIDVKLSDVNGVVIDNFSLGDVQDSDSGGRSVRLKSGQQFVSAEYFDEASSKSEDWVDRNIFHLPDNSVEQISIVGFRSEYSIQRINDDYRIHGRPEESQVNKAMAVRMFGLYERLQFESVVDPGLTDEEVGLAEYELVNVHTRGGFDYVLHVGKSVADGDIKVVRIQILFQDAPEPSRNQADQVDLPDQLSEAKSISATLAQWRFKFLNSMVEQMMPTPGQLLEN